MSPLLPLWLLLTGASARLPTATTPLLPTHRASLCLGGLSCPLGSHCSADGQSCLTLPASRAVPCPDGQSECPDNATCCVTASGAWGCCPMPQASCCADKVHCCPHATRCDLAHGRCLSPTGISVPLGTTFPAWKRQPSLPATPRQVLCPSNHSACPNGSTCCQMASAQYGCCPLQNAICCSDGHHCCPQGTICDLKHSSCSAAWPPLTLVQAQDILCKDGLRCPDGNTCCPSGLGVWGCCPLEEAVCCSDLLHCCPRGTTCDPEGGSCLQEDGGRVPWVQKTPGLRRARDVRCDEVTSCPDGNTCCRLSSGAWGCCPLEEAVCCPDRVHCCPRGTTCDPEGGSCLQEDGGRVPWVQKTLGLRRVGDVRCDELTSCPDGSTCCRLSSGAWGCCPLEEAVCCPDHVHCCPRGTTCDPEGGSCLQEDGGRVPWVQKTLGLRWKGDVRCDKETSCPDGSTCCRLSSGAWGCCPLEQAVCCRDHQHCCPRGYTCNEATESCEKLTAPLEKLLAPHTSPQAAAPLLWRRRLPSTLLRATSTQQGASVPCDATHSCQRGQRCCRSQWGFWGCCPFAQGSCCSDGRHCCPGGSHCTGRGWGCSPQRWDMPTAPRELL